MNSDDGWKDHSNGNGLQYDFVPPRHWTAERLAAEHAAIAAALEARDASCSEQPGGWLGLAQRLPASLRAALVAELRHGNQIAGIGSTGWPRAGSVVVNVRERFTAARQTPPAGVAWRQVNDQRYCREELSQKTASVEFLVIT